MSTNEEIIKNIKATMAVEGLNVDLNEEMLINRFLNNQITDEEGIEIIKNDIISKMGNKNV